MHACTYLGASLFDWMVNNIEVTNGECVMSGLELQSLFEIMGCTQVPYVPTVGRVHNNTMPTTYAFVTTLGMNEDLKSLVNDMRSCLRFDM